MFLDSFPSNFFSKFCHNTFLLAHTKREKVAFPLHSWFCCSFPLPWWQTGINAFLNINSEINMHFCWRFEKIKNNAYATAIRRVFLTDLTLWIISNWSSVLCILIFRKNIWHAVKTVCFLHWHLSLPKIIPKFLMDSHSFRMLLLLHPKFHQLV